MQLSKALPDKGESQSIFNQSEFEEQKSDHIHQCEYWHGLQRSNKTIARKNRQIQTLNRIINNLKSDISALQQEKKNHQQQTNSLKNDLEKAKKKVNELQIKQIQQQRLFCEERLTNARKVHQYSKRNDSKIGHDESPEYFSQCHFSRNTLIEQKVFPEPEIKTFRKQFYDENVSEVGKGKLNMGQLFIGRKLRINEPRLQRHESWCQIDKLSLENNKEKKKGSFHPNFGRNQEQNFSFGGNWGSSDNLNKFGLEQAITYLKKQNQELKVPIY